MKANYLFYFCSDIGSVFDSQVLALIEAINTRNIFKKIYLFLGIRNKNDKNNFLAKQVSAEIEVVFFRSFPNYPFFNFLNRKSIRNALNSQNVNFKQVIFHTRGEMLAFHLSRDLGRDFYKNIIPDVRAAEVEEIIEFSDLNGLRKLWKIINNKTAVKNLNKFHYISVVSNSLKEHLVTNYNIDVKKVFITPCLAGNDFRFYYHKREEIRKEFNLSGDDVLVVFSSGGTANWQNNDVVISLAVKGFKVLNLSKKEIQHKNIINKYVSYSQMYLYLNAADVAIIWRDKSIVNKVASPVKFSEYVCCGLPLIANDSVDLIKEYIVKNSCGLILNNLEDVTMDSLIQLKQKGRQAIAEAGLSNFGIDKITRSYGQIYSELKNL